MQNQSNKVKTGLYTDSQISANSLVHYYTYWLHRKCEVKRGVELSEGLAEFIKWNDLPFTGLDNQTLRKYMPPRLWFRFTPSLGKIEWKVRKLLKDLCK